MRRIKGKLSYANLISTLCLFLLLGGGAYAATRLPKNSVDTKQIKNGAVTGAKIKPQTITGTNINLAKLGTVPTASQADNATNAGHADTAGDANTLQGNSASAFMHGTGRVLSERLDLSNGTPTTTLLDIPGVGTVSTECNSGDGALEFFNHSGGVEDVWFTVDHGGTIILAPTDGETGGRLLGISSGHTVEWQVATRGTRPVITTIDASYSGTGPTTCTTVAQAISSS
jgi:hypothetical protein